MFKDLKETEIKGFLGISTKRTPQINECSDCYAVELRDTKGDILSAANPSSLVTAPDFSSEGFTLVENLGFTTHIYSQLAATEKEVVIYFQRGTVGGFPHIAVGINPSYVVGSGWTDQWKWLNKIVVTTIASVTSAYAIKLTNDISGSVAPFGTIYNVTKNEWATITSTVAGTPGTVYITRNTTTGAWIAGNTVIVMYNYEPLGGTAGSYPYYTAKSAIATANLAFHRVLDDLKVGFGSAAYRLGISVGYKKKYFQIDTLASGDTLTTVTNLDDIVLDPYNIISDSGTFAFAVADNLISGGVPGSTYQAFPTATVSWLFFTVTVTTNDFNEFVVYQSSTGTANSPNISIKPTIRFATMNKQVTKLRIWVSAGRSRTRTEDYRLIKEIDVAKTTALSGVLWTLGADGFLILSNVSTLVDAGYFMLDYNAYIGKTETLGINLTDALGYTPTTNYVSSWDQGLLARNSVYLLNPYDGKTWKNFIFNSPTDMYDVITAGNYKTLDTKDGNNIVGIELNSNENFAIIRNTGHQQYDPDSQISTQTINGSGAASTRLGIVNQNGAIFFPSQFDFFMLQGNRSVNLSEDTIRDVYRNLTKTNIIAAKDNFGSSVILYAPTEQKCYIFIPGTGWIQNNLGVIRYFGSSYDGTLLYMNSAGTIYKLDLLAKVHSTTSNFTWTSVPIDIALLGDEITSDVRFIVASIWLKYASTVAITVYISYDGGPFTTYLTFPVTQTALTSGTLKVGQRYVISKYISGDNFTNCGASANATGIEFVCTDTGGGVGTPTTWTNSSQLTPVTISTIEKIIPPGRNCKSFQIKISGTPNSDNLRSRICSVGIRWDVLKTGLFR